jgi:hypothetical protein
MRHTSIGVCRILVVMELRLQMRARAIASRSGFDNGADMHSLIPGTRGVLFRAWLSCPQYRRLPIADVQIGCSDFTGICVLNQR